MSSYLVAANVRELFVWSVSFCVFVCALCVCACLCFQVTVPKRKHKNDKPKSPESGCSSPEPDRQDSSGSERQSNLYTLAEANMSRTDYFVVLLFYGKQSHT